MHHDSGITLFASAVRPSVIWLCGTYITPTPAFPNPFSRTFPTMPTICLGGSSNCGPSPLPITIIWPSASSFGQYFFAIASLMMTTRAEAPVSVSVNARPRNKGILNTRK